MNRKRSLLCGLALLAFALPGLAADKRDDSASEKLGIKVALQCYTYRGITFFETVDKAAILELLDRSDLPPKVRDVIVIRQQVGKSSTAKYRKAITCAGADGRVRGVLQYHDRPAVQRRASGGTRGRADRRLVGGQQRRRLRVLGD